jgi:signal transduction histidine kinase
MLQQERQKIETTKELHDYIAPQIEHIGRTMAAILQKEKEDFGNFKAKLEEMKLTTHRIVKDIGDLMALLEGTPARRPKLHRHNFLNSLQEIGHLYLSVCKIQFEFQTDVATQQLCQQLNAFANICLNRIYIEAINNICKHSQAARATVILKITNDVLQMQIYDNGNGIAPEVVEDGNGLYNMAYRSRQLQGEFRFESEPNQGTTLYFEFPTHSLKDASFN